MEINLDFWEEVKSHMIGKGLSPKDSEHLISVYQNKLANAPKGIDADLVYHNDPKVIAEDLSKNIEKVGNKTKPSLIKETFNLSKVITAFIFIAAYFGVLMYLVFVFFYLIFKLF